MPLALFNGIQVRKISRICHGIKVDNSIIGIAIQHIDYKIAADKTGPAGY
jgi:hypothetical protein